MAPLSMPLLRVAFGALALAVTCLLQGCGDLVRGGCKISDSYSMIQVNGRTGLTQDQLQAAGVELCARFEPAERDTYGGGTCFKHSDVFPSGILPDALAMDDKQPVLLIKCPGTQSDEKGQGLQRITCSTDIYFDKPDGPIRREPMLHVNGMHLSENCLSDRTGWELPTDLIKAEDAVIVYSSDYDSASGNDNNDEQGNADASRQSNSEGSRRDSNNDHRSSDARGRHSDDDRRSSDGGRRNSDDDRRSSDGRRRSSRDDGQSSDASGRSDRDRRNSDGRRRSSNDDQDRLSKDSDSDSYGGSDARRRDSSNDLYRSLGLDDLLSNTGDAASGSTPDPYESYWVNGDGRRRTQTTWDFMQSGVHHSQAAEHHNAHSYLAAHPSNTPLLAFTPARQSSHHEHNLERHPVHAANAARAQSQHHIAVDSGHQHQQPSHAEHLPPHGYFAVQPRYHRTPPPYNLVRRESSHLVQAQHGHAKVHAQAIPHAFAEIPQQPIYVGPSPQQPFAEQSPQFLFDGGVPFRG